MPERLPPALLQEVGQLRLGSDITLANRTCSALININPISGGVIVDLSKAAIKSPSEAADLAAKYTKISGIKGICFDLRSTYSEAVGFGDGNDILRRVSGLMTATQSLIVRIDTPNATNRDDILFVRAAGVDLVLFGPPTTHIDPNQNCTFVDTIDALALPCVLQVDRAAQPSLDFDQDIMSLAQRCPNIIGITLCCDEHVLQYDQDYYALKRLDRPIAVIPSCDGTLFHNLNTGADGVISRMAIIAPHETTAMYQASIEERFYDAQMLHNRLAPLTGLLAAGTKQDQRKTFEHCAVLQGLPSGLFADQSSGQLDDNRRSEIEQILKDIQLKPIV
jgi:dihydrodipicolinate synthase/N-acetylneuraminate lyase